MHQSFPLELRSVIGRLGPAITKMTLVHEANLPANTIIIVTRPPTDAVAGRNSANNLLLLMVNII